MNERDHAHERDRAHRARLKLACSAGIAATVARVAHECWRAAMSEQGWQCGPEFDDVRKIHDCMVPFDELDPDDQWTVIDNLIGSNAQTILAREVHYFRGGDVPMRTRDMAEGARVESTCCVGPSGQPERGTVLGWTTVPRSGRLESVRVQWDNGQISEHVAVEREIRKAARS